MELPTHSKETPQLAFHRFSVRWDDLTGVYVYDWRVTDLRGQQRS
jgi:hypothetical protein